MNEIHKQFFENMHNTQTTSINESIIRDARRVIKDLVNVIVSDVPTTEVDGAIEHALGWLKNNQS